MTEQEYERKLSAIEARLNMLSVEVESVREEVGEETREGNPADEAFLPPFHVHAETASSLRVGEGWGRDYAGEYQDIAAEVITGVSASGWVYIVRGATEWDAPEFATTLPDWQPGAWVVPIAYITFSSSRISNVRQILTTGAATPLSGDCIAVAMTTDGGADGDDTTAATWTYTLAEFASPGLVLAEDVDIDADPHYWQRDIGPVAAATRGIISFDRDGILVLVWCNELPDSGLCPEPEA
jgi:hypothetical protein